MSICTGLKQQAGDGMGEKKERGRFTLRFNEAIPYTRLPLDYWSYRVPAQKRNMWQMQWSTIMSTLGRSRSH